MDLRRGAVRSGRSPDGRRSTTHGSAAQALSISSAHSSCAATFAVARSHEQVSPVDARESEDLILALIALVQPQDRDPDALQQVSCRPAGVRVRRTGDLLEEAPSEAFGVRGARDELDESCGSAREGDHGGDRLLGEPIRTPQTAAASGLSRRFS